MASTAHMGAGPRHPGSQGGGAAWAYLLVVVAFLVAGGLPASAASPAHDDRASLAEVVFSYLSTGAQTAVLSGVGGAPPPISSWEAVEQTETEADDLRVNIPEEQVCNIQSEVSVARSGNTLVAGWNDSSGLNSDIGECDRRRLGMQVTISGYGYSSDGGQTWTDGGLIRPPGDKHLFGDPVVAPGPGGRFHYATLMRDSLSGPEMLDIALATSSDGGQDWDEPVLVSHSREEPALHDKPWMAVDTTGSKYNGSIYVAWTEFADRDVGCEPGPGCENPEDGQITAEDRPVCPFTPGQDVSCAVLLSRSTDGGQGFTIPIKLSVPALAEPLIETPGLGVQTAIGPSGEVYVAWLTNDADVMFTRSMDGGVTFSRPAEIVDTRHTGDNNSTCQPGASVPVLQGDIRVRNWISMAVDAPSSSRAPFQQESPFRGRIYLAVPTDHIEATSDVPVVFEDESDIAFVYSKNGGKTWENVDAEGRGALAHDDDHLTDQFHPQVAVDSLGRVAVSWYDRRVSGPEQPNWNMAVFGRVSQDGGMTFGPLVQISDVPFPPSHTNPNTGGFSNCYMGEYNGMAGGDSDFLLAWGDNRDGAPANPDPNVYFDRALQCIPATGQSGKGGGKGGCKAGPKG